MEGELHAAHANHFVGMFLSRRVDILINVLYRGVYKFLGLHQHHGTSQHSRIELTKDLSNGRITDKENVPPVEALCNVGRGISVEHAALGLPTLVLRIEPSSFR